MALWIKFADHQRKRYRSTYMRKLSRVDSRAGIRHSLILAIFFLATLFSAKAEIVGDVANGKSLWNANCAACHKLDKKLVGPALGDVTERRTTEWLVRWIRNNQELRESGDKDAIAVWEEYNKSAMPNYPQFSEQDVLDILAYTIDGGKPAVPVGGGEVATTVAVDGGAANRTPLLIGLGLFFLLLILLLAKVKNTLRIVKGEQPESVVGELSGFSKALVKNSAFITLATIVVGVLFLHQLYWALMAVNLEEGYQPEQPIAFSHALHAGENGIDCNYCHSSARHSKHSGIPSANVCMNCHKYIDGSEIKDASGNPKYDGRSPEIAKIYAAIGWDADEGTYIENYEERPIKWVRIHNLPDLAYFNHAQHVNAGGLDCQTCHGPVETMEEVYQYSPLTMGWCINCHRETQVQVESNGYYEEMHAKLAKKYPGEKITVEKIGGLECGKCHY
jgi:mono/diheme cytochrome c family protein